MKIEKLKKSDGNSLNFVYDGKYFGNGSMIFIPTLKEVSNQKDINLLVEMGTIFEMSRGILNTEGIARLKKEEYKGLEYLVEVEEGVEIKDITKTNKGVETDSNSWAYLFEDTKEGLEAYFQAHYIKIIESHYPSATYKYANNKLYVFDDNKIVGVVMAIRI